ncbi:hypothetical protein ACIPXV_03155 [Streptomyces libani]|uniref:hypothetical protein n=1 Tax=Streptomyces nigrescens TaxID=1920 RepID=UPI0038251BB9
MHPLTLFGLELAVELARRGRLVEAVQIGVAAIDQATRDEQPAIRRWLDDHAGALTPRNR